MFLKRLELQGFKSFPEKVKLEFKEGITAVVGPNGSGKSNISDGLRWVLGEQSAKSLRGEKMEDIIFAGTKNRKPLGFAEVSMVIDNSDKRLNIDYDEVTITRRVYRSGDSGFFINGASCRLKEIHELFMDTGVGRDGYSIIGQGRIDTILSTKSEDRRSLFEEAVGIVKFKNRRTEAEKKLEAVRSNLVRTNDIISELEKQIEPLERQAEKTKKYLVLAEKLKNIRVNIFVDEYEKNEKEIEETNKNIDIINTQISDEEAGQRAAESLRDSLKAELRQVEGETEENSAEAAEVRSAAEQKENDIKLVKQEVEYIESDIKRSSGEADKKKADTLKRNEEAELIKTKVRGAELELDLKKRELESLMAEFDKIDIKVSEREELVKKYNTDIMEKMNIAAQAKTEAASSQVLLGQLNEKAVQTEGELDFSKSRLEEKKAHYAACKKLFDEICQKEESLKKRIDELLKQAQKINKERNELKQKQSILSASVNTGISRQKVLAELERDYEGYNNAVKAILKQKNTNPAFKGVKGAVGELIKVEEKYETAIEIALGANLQNIITTDEYSAKACMNYLKTNKKGRATFLPMTTIKGRALGHIKNQLLNERDVLGIADELISFSEEYREIMSNLLGRVIISSNIDSAVELAKKYNHAYKIVTVEGEVLNPGGSMTGGSVFKKAGGVFSRGRELKELDEKIKNEKNQLSELENRIYSMESDYKELVSDGERARSLLNSANVEKAEKNSRTEQARADIEELDRKINELEAEKKQLKEQICKIEQRSEEQKSISESIGIEIEKLSSELTQYQEKIQRERDFKEESSQKINELKIKISSSEYEIASLNNDIQRIISENEGLERDRKYLLGDIEKQKTQREFKLKEIERYEGEIIKLKELSVKLSERADTLNEKKCGVNRKIEEINEKIIGFTETMGKLNNEKVRLEGKIENVENKNRQLCDSMWEDYELTYASACGYEKTEMDYNELKAGEKSIKGQINALGSINPEAVEEFKAVKERYEFNIKQRDDILKADDDLKNIIAKLVEDMEEQFESQFKIINENFGSVFAEIFGGGTAKLKLTDEENILTSGIEIVAQPPGKNLQSLTLLSGGERTLTAVSLLFAIFRMKPSPFCILDETEAALDDANVIRYANYLKKISDENQFIVITHKTGTMEAADVLYGVTMEEQGVSKIISVKLTEAESITKN